MQLKFSCVCICMRLCDMAFMVFSSLYQCVIQVLFCLYVDDVYASMNFEFVVLDFMP